MVLPQSATAMDAIAAMVENNEKAVLIDRADTEDDFGIITSTDVISGVISRGLDPATMNVMEICSKPLVALNNLDLDMRWVAKKMANEGISRVAVFEGEDLKCFVSDVDILRTVAAELKAAPPKQAAKRGGRGRKR